MESTAEHHNDDDNNKKQPFFNPKESYTPKKTNKNKM